MPVWQVPLADLVIPEEDVAAVADVYRSGWLSMGPRTAEFERALADYTGARHALGTANGTAALHLICMAAGLGPGDEVVVPSFTFYASAEAIPPTGARPVFCDVDPETFCATPETVQAVMTPRTKAVSSVKAASGAAPTRAMIRMLSTA